LVGVLAYAIFRAGRRHLLVVQVAVLGLLGGGIWNWGPERAPENGGVLPAFIDSGDGGGGVFAAAGGAVGPAFVCAAGGGLTLQAGAAGDGAVQSRGRTEAVGRELLWQVLAGLLSSGLLVLLPAAVAVLLAPPAFTWWAGVGALGGMVLVVLFAALNERLYAMVRILTARFFRNAALGVALLLIALGSARMGGVPYVTTVFDGATGLEVLLSLGFALRDYVVVRLLDGAAGGAGAVGITAGGGGDGLRDPVWIRGPGGDAGSRRTGGR
jgi:hypothetical protein